MRRSQVKPGHLYALGDYYENPPAGTVVRVLGEEPDVSFIRGVPVVLEAELQAAQAALREGREASAPAVYDCRLVALSHEVDGLAATLAASLGSRRQDDPGRVGTAHPD